MCATRARQTNVLCLIDELTTGGAQTALFNVVDNLDPRLYRPYVLALFKDGRVGDVLRERGMFAESLGVLRPFTPSTFVKLYGYLVDFVRKRHVDVVHSFLTASAIYGGLVARRMGLPSLLNVHTELSRAEIVGKRSTRYLELLARSLNRTLIAGNRMTEAELRRLRVWRNPSTIRMIYNGIQPVGELRSGLCEQETVVITMVANFFPQKDHLTLIKAYERLRCRYPVHLRMIAEGQGFYRDGVMKYVDDRSLHDIAWQSTKDDRTYATTDIFVLTTHSEGDPIVLKEAMSVGIPCIASRVGAVGEIIEDGIDGVLIDDGDVEGLVQALIRLIEDREYRGGLSRRALDKYRRKFTLRTMTCEYESLYAQIIGVTS